MVTFWDADLLDLQLFEGDGGAAGAAGDGAAAGGETGVTDQAAAEPEPKHPRRVNRNPLANVQYGKQEAQATEAAAAPAANEADPAAEWADLRNGKYKQQFDADVQAIVKKRLGTAKDSEAKLQSIMPMLDALVQKNGLEAGDYDGLSKLVLNDDSLYEQEALERGVSVDTLRQIKALEEDNRRYKQAEQLTLQEQSFQRHINNLAAQGEQVKQMYPGFNLRAELKNPDFARLTSPNVGVDVKTAYEIVHHNEIAPAAMQYAVQRSQEKLANSIRSGSTRPTEGGVRNSPAIDVRDDPKKWTKADREEVRRRVKSGERIVL